MIKLFFGFCIVSMVGMISSCAPPLQVRNGLIYQGMSRTPYTGEIVHKYKNGNIKDKIYITNGWKVGQETSWYPNGLKHAVVNYKHSKLDGIATEWYDNGHKKAKTTYENGKQIGVGHRWYDNGQSSFQTSIQ